MKVLKTLSYATASSRPLQALFSMAQPLFAALLAVKGFPESGLFVLLIISCVAGMFSVFAINDLLDYDTDRKNAKANKKNWDVDSLFARHPFAAGLISRTQQVAWISILAVVSASILYTLNPLALALYIFAIAIEMIYCKLSRVSELKTIAAGILVATGGIIGWLAAGGGISAMPLFLIALLFFSWEIGGRNIANDMSDTKEDKRVGIKTVPSVHGPKTSSRLIFILVLATIAANILLASTLNLDPMYARVTTVLGILFLLLPSISLLKNPTEENALRYFNKASIYPVLLLICAAAVYIASAY